MLRALLITALASLPAQAAGGGKTTWHLRSSPHFEIMHESVWSPSSVVLELEGMYSSMRLNLSMFAPWMVREKTRVYIYSDQTSYLAGEFNPPRWSKGLAYVARKTIVVYDSGDMAKLKAVIAHELTHLYFESYFAERLKYPPQWLNEGLAVYLEDSSYREGGPWGRALAYFQPERRYPFETFFKLRIDALKSDSQISDWYLQAFGTVFYLYRPHQRVQFKAFCDALRSGVTEQDALWRNYRIREGDDFSDKWSAWLEKYSEPDAQGSPSGIPSASFNFKPVQFVNFGDKR